jgi:inner membrane protein
MDTLTHGLLGACLAALPLPSWLERRGDQAVPARASILASVLAAELPDLDYLLPAKDAVLHTLQAHRGVTHSLVAVPLVALAAALLTKAVFRRARLLPLYARALLSVPLAHLLPDLWTGWGTRLFLPFSDRRFALDWTMVLDPVFTAPLLAAALWASFRRRDFRRAMAVGAAFAAVYLALRVVSLRSLTHRMQEAYPSAATVDVFPAPFSVMRCRYVARLGASYAAGYVGWRTPHRESARVPALPGGPLSEALTAVPTVREALAWARFPVVRVVPLARSEQRVEVADLRYHLHGAPTLTFVVTIDARGEVKDAQLLRGGSASELWRRLRASLKRSNGTKWNKMVQLWRATIGRNCALS